MLRSLWNWMTRSSQPSPENPSWSLNDPETWRDLFADGQESDAGVVVSPTTALSLGAVWQAVSMISGDVAKLPLGIYLRGDGEPRRMDRTHPVYDLVNRRANDETPAFRLWRDAMVDALVYNNAYIWIDRAGSGKPLGLYNLLPDRTQFERSGGTPIFTTETTRSDGSPWLRRLEFSDVLHIRGPSLDHRTGCDLLFHARHAIGLGLAAQKFAAKFFKHGVRTGGILEIPQTTTPKAADKLEEGFRRHHEGEDNWFRTVVLRDGAKFHQTSIPPNEGQMTETRQAQVAEVARYFNLPASRLGLKDSVSYNSLEADNRTYLDCCLMPWLCDIASQVDFKLLDASRFAEHNTKALLSMDTAARFSAYRIACGSPFQTVNEIRRAENLPPVEGGDMLAPVQGAALPGGADVTGTRPPRGPADDTGATTDVSA